LKVGENRFAQSFLEFPDAPVTFKLTQGSGPVHINGHHLLGDFDGIEDMEEEGEGDEEDDSENEIRAGDDDEEPKSKKQKVAANNVKSKNEKNNKKK
jgi:nucleophosmin 3